MPQRPLVWTIAGMAAFNLLTVLRLRRPWPVRDAELFGQLLLDVAALTVLLYFSGGSTNPFVMLSLLPLALTAAALPGVYTWVVTAVTVACYSALMFWYVPLPQSHGAHGDEFALHVLGMWIGFVLSAGLIAWFAVQMAATVRSRDQLLAAMREQELKHERILALGTLATGAAHELGTPLHHGGAGQGHRAGRGCSQGKAKSRYCSPVLRPFITSGRTKSGYTPRYCVEAPVIR